jgi:hypothetical protein
MDLKTHCEKVLRNLIITTIKCDLTVGRIDNDLEKIEDERINEFINNNENNIKNIINEMIFDYEKDDELDDLKTPENDWVREYMYCFINYDTV